MRFGAAILAFSLSAPGYGQAPETVWSRAGQAVGFAAPAVSADGRFMALCAPDGVRVVRTDGFLIRTLPADAPRAVFLSGGGLAVLDVANRPSMRHDRLRIFDSATFSHSRAPAAPTDGDIAQDGILDSEPGRNLLAVNGALVNPADGSRVTIPPFRYAGTAYAPLWVDGFGPLNGTARVHTTPDASFLVNSRSGTFRIALPSPICAVPVDLRSYAVLDGGTTVYRSRAGTPQHAIAAANRSLLWNREGTLLAFSGESDSSAGIGVWTRGRSVNRWTLPGFHKGDAVGGATATGFGASQSAFDGVCRLLAWNDGAELARLTWARQNASVALSPDGATVAVWSHPDGENPAQSLFLFDAANGGLKREIPVSAGVRSVAWSGDARLMVGHWETGGSNAMLEAFDPATGSRLWARSSSGNGVLKVSTARGGATLVAWDDTDGLLNEFIDPATGAVVRGDHRRTGLPGTLSPSGNRIAFAGYRTVVVKDLRFDLLRRWNNVGNPFTADENLAFSPSGLLAVASTEGVFLGDVASGAYRRISSEPCSAVRFTSDGAGLLASQGELAAIRLRLFNAGSGSLRRTWTENLGSTGAVSPRSLASGPTGGIAFFGASDGTVAAIRLP